jgi:hypothetical protein
LKRFCCRKSLNLSFRRRACLLPDEESKP